MSSIRRSGARFAVSWGALSPGDLNPPPPLTLCFPSLFSLLLFLCCLRFVSWFFIYASLHTHHLLVLPLSLPSHFFLFYFCHLSVSSIDAYLNGQSSSLSAFLADWWWLRRNGEFAAQDDNDGDGKGGRGGHHHLPHLPLELSLRHTRQWQRCLVELLLLLLASLLLLCQSWQTIRIDAKCTKKWAEKCLKNGQNWSASISSISTALRGCFASGAMRRQQRPPGLQRDAAGAGRSSSSSGQWAAGRSSGAKTAGEGSKQKQRVKQRTSKESQRAEGTEERQGRRSSSGQR